MNARVIAFVVAVAVCACVAHGMCDQWGVRKCGIEFNECTMNATTPTVQNATCECYRTMGDCLAKYDCASEGPYYVFHYTCISYEKGVCGDICGNAASSLAIPALALLVSALLYTLF